MRSHYFAASLLASVVLIPSAAVAGAVTEAGKRGSKHHEYAPPKSKNCRNTGRFSTWLANFKKEAVAKGISQRTISTVLGGMRLNPKIIARDRRQGFFAQSFVSFQKKLATQHRVVSSRRKIKKNKATFDRAQRDYGVAPAVNPGLWALESDFGAGMGKDPIFRSLATLAYDCRRSDMFRTELLAALEIIDRGDVRPSGMVGSWAGEIGQTQFLPTRYLEYAIDYNNDGRTNLFRSDADVIGSTANYMRDLGWQANQPWIEEVRVPRKLPWEESGLENKHPISKWSAWGVRKANGNPLNARDLQASLLLPMGRLGPAFLAYPNFDIYLKWNQSLNYATTAAYLATRIDGAPLMRRPNPNIPILSPDRARELQRRLKKRGFDVGEIDGIIGAKSRAAIKTMQIKFGMPADAYPTPSLLNRLR